MDAEEIGMTPSVREVMDSEFGDSPAGSPVCDIDFGDATPDNSFFADWSKTPAIVTVAGSNFYVCQYTGATTPTRAGLPGFLVGKSLKSKELHGSFKNWNVLFRALVAGVSAKRVEESVMDAISSWFAETYGEKNMKLAPPATTLLRFGGKWSDEDYDNDYPPYDAAPLIRADEEARERQLARTKKAMLPNTSVPTLAATLKELSGPGPSFFKVCVWPKVPTFFSAVPYDEHGDFAATVKNTLHAERLPTRTLSPTIFTSGPPALPVTAERWLDANARPAKAAAIAAAREAEKAAKAAERKKEKGSTPQVKPKRKRTSAPKPNKRKTDMAQFAASAAALLS